MPFAPSTKNKVKGVFGTFLRHGMRYQWAATNPIALVRSSSKRVSEPDILTPTEIRAIVTELTEPARTLTLLAAITGMRRGELVGLKWEDLTSSGGQSASFEVWLTRLKANQRRRLPAN